MNLNKTIVVLSVCALANIAFGDDQNQQMSDSNTETNNMSSQPVTAQGFVRMAAHIHMKEIHLGELALQKSDNSDVKSFAKRIVADHKKSCKKLQAIAEKEGLECPTNYMDMAGNMNDRWNSNSMAGDMNDRTNSGNFENPAMEKQDKDSPPHLASLLVSTNMDDMGDQMAGPEVNWNALSGADFNRAFASSMVKGHEQAIRKFENAANNLQDADLKKYAKKTLPTLREHLRKAQELQSQVGTWSDADMTNSMRSTADSNQ